jgi:pimeloyl-ACP methyl ester carboxylesterase
VTKRDDQAENRTNVRLFSATTRSPRRKGGGVGGLRRVAVRLAELVAPGRVAEWALDQWGRTRRPRGGTPEMTGGHRFTMTVGEKQVVAWDWGTGPTVLLVHGWNGYGAQLCAFVGPLVQAGFHVVAFDMPAHGRSEGDRSNILEMRDAVLAVAKRMQHVHAVVAHSLGATATVLAMAAGAPIDRAVLLAPPAESPPFARAFARGMGLSEAGAERMVARLRAFVGDEVGAVDVRPVVGNISAPLLVMHDREDRDVPFAHGESIAAAAAARFVPLAGLGHRRLLGDEVVILSAVTFILGFAESVRAAS